MTEYKKKLPAKIVCSATAAILGMLVLVFGLGVMFFRVRQKRQGYIFVILIVDLNCMSWGSSLLTYN